MGQGNMSPNGIYGQDNAAFEYGSKEEGLGVGPPAYREEDILGLTVTGKNVYSGEKKALMNLLEGLLAD